jgi:hypothetical protein
MNGHPKIITTTVLVFLLGCFIGYLVGQNNVKEVVEMTTACANGIVNQHNFNAANEVATSNSPWLDKTPPHIPKSH